MKMFASVLPVAAAIAVVSAQAAHAQSLKVGSVAPAIKVARWVKGKPVSKLTGEINVVEFWATWCGPCRTSIPHLTDMAKKYHGKVNFTGVSVWERDPKYLTKVEAFVKDMGPKMAYNVAADDKPSDGFMATNWMKAAGQDGIPTAFIVGKNGKIVWIGHPMEMEPVLEQVVAGTFDAAAAATKAQAARTSQMKLNNAMQAVMQLARAGKNEEAVTALDKVIAENPEMAPNLQMFKFGMQLKFDEAGAAKTANELAEGPGKDNAMILNALAWQMVDEKGGAKNPDLDLALKLAQRAVEITKENDGMILDTLAFVHFKRGDIKSALACQEKAVAKMPASLDPEMKKEITDRLAMYKSKAN